VSENYTDLNYYIHSDQQRKFLANALGVVNRLPSDSPSTTATAQQNAKVEEESAWKNSWNWNLPDAAFGSLVLDVKDGRVSSEMKSQGKEFRGSLMVFSRP